MKCEGVFGIAAVLAMITLGCTARETIATDCDPDARFPDSLCLIDAGADTGADDADPDAADGSAAKADCAGRCTPAPSGDHAGTFAKHAPISVWVGPKELMPMCCPGADGCDILGAVPTRLYRRFKDIVAPPAACEPCECGASEGTCTALPGTIEIRAGTCGQGGVSSLPFYGPAGWDGSCSSDGALPTGAMCNGVPCAQSVWAPPLPGPTSEVCTPKKVAPSFSKKPAEWVIGALACEGKPRDESCGDAADETCYEDPGPGWWQCVYEDGIHDFCPENYWKEPIVMYPEEAIVDDRGCEACSCGEPVGSGCYGAIRVYNDGACSSQFADVTVSSFAEGCENVNPPGHVLGAKSIEKLGYMPGTCAASGGFPTGTATENTALGNIDGQPGPVTFCCTSFFGLE